MRAMSDGGRGGAGQKVLKGRLQTAEGGAAKGMDGEHSHLFLEFLETRPPPP
jgi:hypothetical protein